MTGEMDLGEVGRRRRSLYLLLLYIEIFLMFFFGVFGCILGFVKLVYYM